MFSAVVSLGSAWAKERFILLQCKIVRSLADGWPPWSTLPPALRSIILTMHLAWSQANTGRCGSRPVTAHSTQWCGPSSPEAWVSSATSLLSAFLRLGRGMNTPSMSSTGLRSQRIARPCHPPRAPWHLVCSHVMRALTYKKLSGSLISPVLGLLVGTPELGLCVCVWLGFFPV